MLLLLLPDRDHHGFLILKRLICLAIVVELITLGHEEATATSASATAAAATTGATAASSTCIHRHRQWQPAAPPPLAVHARCGHEQ